MQDRFSNHIKLIQKELNYIEKHSEHLGGIDHLNNELTRHKMSPR